MSIFYVTAFAIYRYTWACQMRCIGINWMGSDLIYVPNNNTKWNRFKWSITLYWSYTCVCDVDRLAMDIIKMYISWTRNDRLCSFPRCRLHTVRHGAIGRYWWPITSPLSHSKSASYQIRNITGYACGGGENVPGIPGTCTTRKFTYLARGPWHEIFSDLGTILMLSPGPRWL